MAILAFQKPDKVIMLESTDRFGKFENSARWSQVTASLLVIHYAESCCLLWKALRLPVLKFKV